MKNLALIILIFTSLLLTISCGEDLPIVDNKNLNIQADTPYECGHKNSNVLFIFKRTTRRTYILRERNNTLDNKHICELNQIITNPETNQKLEQYVSSYQHATDINYCRDIFTNRFTKDKCAKVVELNNKITKLGSESENINSEAIPKPDTQTNTAILSTTPRQNKNTQAIINTTKNENFNSEAIPEPETQTNTTNLSEKPQEAQNTKSAATAWKETIKKIKADLN